MVASVRRGSTKQQAAINKRDDRICLYGIAGMLREPVRARAGILLWARICTLGLEAVAANVFGRRADWAWW